MMVKFLLRYNAILKAQRNQDIWCRYIVLVINIETYYSLSLHRFAVVEYYDDDQCRKDMLSHKS